jgi:hypothetical protein
MILSFEDYISVLDSIPCRIFGRREGLLRYRAPIQMKLIKGTIANMAAELTPTMCLRGTSCPLNPNRTNYVVL